MTTNQSFAAVSGAISVLLWGATAWGEPVRALEPDVVVCTQIKTAKQLSAIRHNLSGIYCLAKDIDLSAIANFVPIGDQFVPFIGRLYGNNHVIRNLTINSASSDVGLFGGIGQGARVQDLFLLNVNVTSTGNSFVGALTATTTGENTIARVYVSGRVTCATSTNSCLIGGLAGGLGQQTTLAQCGSAAIVIGFGNRTGGLAGSSLGIIQQCYATGAVTSTDMAGGLVGENQGTITRSYATGPVTSTDAAGGLVGVNCCDNAAIIKQSYASGPVRGSGSGRLAGLVAELLSAVIDESYAIGNVSDGATLDGLVGIKVQLTQAPVVTDSYWDTQTSGQATSAAGTGMTTAQLQAALPSGFGNVWWITPTYSYPFLNDVAFDFTSPLATSVVASKLFAFLPVSQLDTAQYLGTPAHNSADKASLATVYTMIARAIGLTDNVPRLKDVKIDRYFWRDATQNAVFSGPVTTHASIGAFTPIAANTVLNDNNVIGALKANRLVILRGRYTKGGGGIGMHWLLATLFTSQANGATVEVVGNDPLTGEQVTIDPKTKTITSPSGFPLAGFKVDGFQPVIFH